MKPAARITDMHVCPMLTPGLPPIPHVGGPVTMGCPTVLIGGLPAARVGDITTCVGPPDPIAMGSATVIIGGMPAARMGDMTTHGGTIVLGCPTVLIGDAGGGGGGGGAGTGGGDGAAGGGAEAPPPQVVAAYQSGAAASVGPVSPDQVGPLQPKTQPKEKTWIGIILKDFKRTPLPDQDFQITLEGGQTLSGRTDSKGYARFDQIDPDQGEVAFTNIPEAKEAAAARRKEERVHAIKEQEPPPREKEQAASSQGDFEELGELGNQELQEPLERSETEEEEM
jgi:uncharacterized Zn-binding protein involved in type VI secretion